MKKILILAAFVLLLALQFASAEIQVSIIADKSTSHNSIIPLSFNITNPGADVSDIILKISNVSNSSQIFDITITNNTKKSILSGNLESYSLNYAVPKYIAPGTYPVTVYASGNQSGTIVSATKTFNIAINETTSIDMSEITITAFPGRNITSSFAITNNGNVNLSDIRFTPVSVMNDTNNYIIRPYFQNFSSLAAGETKVVNFNLSIPERQKIKSYNTILKVDASGNSFDVTRNVSLTVNLEKKFCEIGIIGGDLNLEIRNPDGGDDFYPSDDIDVDVRIRNYDNNDKDITVEADIFDVTDGEFLDVGDEYSLNIADDDTETITLNLKVPSDVYDDHVYRVYVKVYEDGAEDEQCVEDFVGIDIKKNTHDVAIEKINLQDQVSCDSNFELSLTLSNVGDRDEDVKVRVYNTELGISEEKTISLDQNDDRIVSFSLKSPKNADEKNYTLRIEAQYYKSGSTYKESTLETAVLQLKGSCIAVSSASLNAEVVNQPAPGEKFSVKVTIFNTGQKVTSYKFSISGYNDWATLEKIEPSELSIDSDDSGTAYIYLTPKAGITGLQSLTVKALYDGKTTQQTVNVSVNERTTAKGLYSRAVDKLHQLSGFDIATINIVLIIAIILLVLWVVKLKR